MTFEELKWPLMLFGFVLILVVFEYRIASRKKGGVSVVDRRMMRGMVGIGFALAALVWFLQSVS